MKVLLSWLRDFAPVEGDPVAIGIDVALEMAKEPGRILDLVDDELTPVAKEVLWAGFRLLRHGWQVHSLDHGRTPLTQRASRRSSTKRAYSSAFRSSPGTRRRNEGCTVRITRPAPVAASTLSISSFFWSRVWR